MTSPIPANKIWLQLLEKVITRGAMAEPRGMSTYELLGETSLIDMQQPIVYSSARNLSYKHMAAETKWILSGSNKLHFHPVIEKNLAKYSDNGITLRGAYGPPIVLQLAYIQRTLQNDPNSRQAVLTIWRPCPRPSKDIPCTLSMQFLIRNRALHCVVSMRSSDIWLGWPYDVFVFSSVALFVRELVNPVLKLGNLHLTAGSQHLYQKNHFAATQCLEVGDENLDMYLYGNLSPDVLMERLGIIMDMPSEPLIQQFSELVCL